NRPTYNISLYLEELHGQFDREYQRELKQTRAEAKRRLGEEEKKLGRRLTKKEKKQFGISPQAVVQMRKDARYVVASNVVREISLRLREPLSLDATNFERHYETRLVLPFPVVSDVDPTNIARFEEEPTNLQGVDIEVQSTRVYPFGNLAAHVLGHVKRDDRSVEGEEAFFSYRLPDYRGMVGVEFGFDKELRGAAGAKSVLVNNLGYRQTENVWSPAEPGEDVVLTIDANVQRAAEQALASARVAYTGPVRGAVVVMDVQTGDILAMASSPTLNPNVFIPTISKDDWTRIESVQAEKNRATQENYMPGSIFKTVVGLAALEAGLNPLAKLQVEANPREPGKGHIVVGGRSIRDTAPPGAYDFRRALMLSCNSYFITNGLRLGPERIIRLGEKFHFGERIGLPLNQETAGFFPRLDRRRLPWTDGNTANMSIGQDPVLVTPLQVAVQISALANGGKVLEPRLVDRLQPQSFALSGLRTVFARRQVRDELGVSARSLAILQEAMLADTEDPEGTGKHVRDHDPLPSLHICAKTGTAEIQDIHNRKTGKTTWFASFAPYPNPKWAVVVMVENGASGGTTCSPVAGPVYAALLKREQAVGRENLARSP
ncbi:MAG TPA: penicillin-binding transpeptidase domain-containing protein, partial [Verrucomicrobiae bacterium]|nr:penicillin-binding transpeptidase domain-containing protein [Verrucomicrobiae bacterium]